MTGLRGVKRVLTKERHETAYQKWEDQDQQGTQDGQSYKEKPEQREKPIDGNAVSSCSALVFNECDASAEALRRNRALQHELRKALMQMAKAEEASLKQAEALKPLAENAPKKLRFARSFFSDPRDRKSVPPKNLDAVRRHIFNEKHGVHRKTRPWGDDENKSLLEVLRNQLLHDAFRQIYHQKVKSARPAERAKCFADAKAETEHAGEAELWSMLENTTDWHSVARHLAVRGFVRTAKSCHAHYVHLLHPNFDRGPMTKQDDMLLLKLSTQQEGYNWDAVAEGLPAPRTAWRCFARYQRSLNNSLLKSEWTLEDERLLEQTRREFGGVGKHLGWCGVSARMGPGRTSLQVQNFHNRTSCKWNNGPWSFTEIRRLSLAVRICGESWQQVAKHVPGRNAVACQQRWTLTDSPDLKRPSSLHETAKFFSVDRQLPWSPEEDDSLLASLQKYGAGNWTLMMVDLPGRTPAQIARRFQKLNPDNMSDVYDVLLATKKRVMPHLTTHSWGKRARHECSQLSASDFSLRLFEQPSEKDSSEQADIVPRLTTGDPASDIHLRRINYKRRQQFKQMLRRSLNCIENRKKDG
eukprot:TRINITY_DN60318_c0_g1_i1.p1 TRINITY_DN60318_c0_g1~~TRINITY_DN60318_c0_g1_i1.p1  ORF type:complete len:583 (-),score=102.53 TRINITY_DN60318_c0_g1_i1:98-1846(-)